MKKKMEGIVGLVVLGVAVTLLVALLLGNSSDKSSKVAVETKKLEQFKAAVLAECKEYKVSTEDYALELAKTDAIGLVTNVQSMFSSTSVDPFALDLVNLINNFEGTAAELISTLVSKLNGLDVDEFVDGVLGDSNKSTTTTTTLTLASTTVCNSVKDTSYCLDGKKKKLSANVYVHDKNSKKWVVLVHPFMTSGSVIYSALGNMYKEQGYNVLAPDLRGFGNSDGSVAMGYLESLDVYDWIKDLNTRYNDSERYNVPNKPEIIIVHGISLGGATTLQLATNPDIAKSNASLTSLNVKGFVDDCGYTSMSKIITGMLSGGDLSSLTSVVGPMGVDLKSFMNELQNVLGDLGVSGFNDIDLSKFAGIEEFISELSTLEETLKSANSGSSVDSSVQKNLNKYFGSVDWSKVEEKYGNIFNWDYGTSNNSWNGNSWGTGNGSKPSDFKPDDGSDFDWSKCIQDWSSCMRQTGSMGDAKVALINKNANVDNGDDFLDDVIGTVLMNLVGVGLTEDNYDKYSDAFYSDGVINRQFPAESKVLVIHGTADTTVPHSNANIVATNAGNRLFYQWNASGKPHAFVVVGVDKKPYANLIAEFTRCLDGGSCKATKIN